MKCCCEVHNMIHRFNLHAQRYGAALFCPAPAGILLLLLHRYKKHRSYLITLRLLKFLQTATGRPTRVPIEVACVTQEKLFSFLDLLTVVYSVHAQGIC